MFDTRTTAKPSGEVVPLHSSLSEATAGVLYRLVLETRPAVAVEVGMAYGVSSLAILAALRRTGGNGRLISIDPHQFTQWEGCGVAAVERAGLKDRHELIEDYDYLALPRLLGSGRRVGFAFIDGWHTFDYTLLDFWYLDKMLDVGGVIGFDDCEYRAVHKAIRFVQSHRRYEEIKTGLTVAGEDYSGPRGRVKQLVGHKLLNRIRRWTGRKSVLQTYPNRYFRKAQEWEPDWNFFADF
jgi:predicted O-methyltransferase YrrM